MRCIIPLILAIASVSCTNSPTRTAEKPRGESPIITTIVSRRSTIIVRAGRTEPIYSVQTAKGEALVKDLPMSEIVRRHPDVADRIQAMQVDTLYAGVELYAGSE